MLGSMSAAKDGPMEVGIKQGPGGRKGQAFLGFTLVFSMVGAQDILPIWSPRLGRIPS